MRAAEVDTDTVRSLLKFSGLDIVEEDLPKLVTALRQHLAAIEVLPVVEIADVESPLIFQVKWDE